MIKTTCSGTKRVDQGEVVCTNIFFLSHCFLTFKKPEVKSIQLSNQPNTEHGKFSKTNDLVSSTINSMEENEEELLQMKTILTDIRKETECMTFVSLY